MINHISPTPWKLHVNPLYPRLVSVTDANGDEVETTAASSDGNEMATIQLIAAAPELLSALKDIFKMIDERMICRDTSNDHLPIFSGMAMGLVTRLKFAHDAIAKAEGRS